MSIHKIQLKDYTIHISDTFGESDAFSEYLLSKKYSSVFILADENTSAFCLPLVEKKMPVAFKTLKILSGESQKNLRTCEQLWNELINNNADRKSVLINLGGGVIGDMGGFVASTFKRGFDFIHIPTTLLSQVDASVGGKLAIDFNEMKNIVGVFNNPKQVFIAAEFLSSLPFAERRSGFAEVIKHGLIHDKKYFDSIKNIQPQHNTDWKKIITGSVQIKKKIVEADMYETGLRKILNFGHTIGHAVETMSLRYDTNPLLHGEAIAIGMLCESYLSSVLCKLPKNELEEIIFCICKIYPKYNLSHFDTEELSGVLKQDKKNKSGTFLFSLLDKIGQCSFDIPVTEELILKSLEMYKAL